MDHLQTAPRGSTVGSLPQYSSQACMESCTQCHQTCMHEALQFGLRAGGQHTDSDHFRLMMSCAEICQTCANFQLADSPYCPQVAMLCAEICRACAASCEQLGDMPDVVAACRECAECCEKLASHRRVTH
jgi:hypothetical protein